MLLGAYLTLTKYLSLEEIYRLAGICEKTHYDLTPREFQVARQAFLLIPITQLLSHAKSKQEQLEVYAKYYSHLPKQGSVDWKKARTGEIILPLVAGQQELRYVAHAHRVEGDLEGAARPRIDLYHQTLASINELVQRELIKTSIAFGGSEVTKLSKVRDPHSAAREKMLNGFSGNIHTRWGNVFEDAINEFMDMHLGNHTVSFGSIPGMRDEDGATIQTYSPDGVIVAQLDKIEKTLELYMGREKVAEHPNFEAFRNWLAAKREAGDTDAAILYEFKCPPSRIPDGTIPDNYTLQPEIGADTIRIVEACLFVDTSFRKCRLEDFGFSNNNYDHAFHLKDGDTFSGPPLACGVLGIYMTGKTRMNQLAELCEMAQEIQGQAQEEEQADHEAQVQGEVQVQGDQAQGVQGDQANGERAQGDQAQEEVQVQGDQANGEHAEVESQGVHEETKDETKEGQDEVEDVASEPNTFAQLRPEVLQTLKRLLARDLAMLEQPDFTRPNGIVIQAGLVYRYLHVLKVWQPKLDTTADVNNYLGFTESIKEIQDRLRRKARYSIYKSNEQEEPEVSEEEMEIIKREMKVADYLRLNHADYRKEFHSLIVEVITSLSDYEQEQVESEVTCVIELLDRPQGEIQEGLTDYGKATTYELDNIFRQIVDNRESEEGVKVYYPKGYYCARDIYDPRFEIIEKRPENWIDFSIVDETRRAKEWLSSETSRFMEFCHANGYTPLGLLPYKIMKLSIVPLIPRGVSQELRPIIEQSVKICNQLRGLSEGELLIKLSELSGDSPKPARNGSRGRRARNGKNGDPGQEEPVVQETSELDIFLGM